MTQNPNYENFRDGRTPRDFTYSEEYKRAIAQIPGRYWDEESNQWKNAGSGTSNRNIPTGDAPSESKTTITNQEPPRLIGRNPDGSPIYAVREGGEYVPQQPGVRYSTPSSVSYTYENTPSWSDVDIRTGEHTGKWEYRNTGPAYTPEGIRPASSSGGWERREIRDTTFQMFADSGEPLVEGHFEGTGELLGVQYSTRIGESPPEIIGTSQFKASETDGILRFERWSDKYPGATVNQEYIIDYALGAQKSIESYRRRAVWAEIEKGLAMMDTVEHYRRRAVWGEIQKGLGMMETAENFRRYNAANEYRKNQEILARRSDDKNLFENAFYGQPDPITGFVPAEAPAGWDKYVVPGPASMKTTRLGNSDITVSTPTGIIIRPDYNYPWWSGMRSFTEGAKGFVAGAPHLPQSLYNVAKYVAWASPLGALEESSRRGDLATGNMGAVASNVFIEHPLKVAAPAIGVGVGVAVGVSQLATGDIGGLFTGVAATSAGVMGAVDASVGTPARAGRTVGSLVFGTWLVGKAMEEHPTFKTNLESSPGSGVPATERFIRTGKSFTRDSGRITGESFTSQEYVRNWGILGKRYSYASQGEPFIYDYGAKGGTYWTPKSGYSYFKGQFGEVATVGKTGESLNLPAAVSERGFTPAINDIAPVGSTGVNKVGNIYSSQTGVGLAKMKGTGTDLITGKEFTDVSGVVYSGPTVAYPYPGGAYLGVKEGTGSFVPYTVRTYMPGTVHVPPTVGGSGATVSGGLEISGSATGGGGSLASIMKTESGFQFLAQPAQVGTSAITIGGGEGSAMLGSMMVAQSAQQSNAQRTVERSQTSIKPDMGVITSSRTSAINLVVPKTKGASGVSTRTPEMSGVLPRESAITISRTGTEMFARTGTGMGQGLIYRSAQTIIPKQMEGGISRTGEPGLGPISGGGIGGGGGFVIKRPGGFGFPSFSGGTSSGFNPFRARGQRKKYNPSLVASELGITTSSVAKGTAGSLGGLGIRPIIRRSKRRRR